MNTAPTRLARAFHKAVDDIEHSADLGPKLKVSPGVAGAERSTAMSMQTLAVPRSERGMTTAEYALGTIAVVSLVGVIISVITGGGLSKEISQVVNQIIDWIQDFIKKQK